MTLETRLQQARLTHVQAETHYTYLLTLTSAAQGAATQCRTHGCTDCLRGVDLPSLYLATSAARAALGAATTARNKLLDEAARQPSNQPTRRTNQHAEHAKQQLPSEL